MDKVDQIMGRLDQMLLRADEIVEDACEKYAVGLGDDLAALSDAVESGDRDAAIHQAYRVKGRAGTLGWPLISAGTNALAKLFERCPHVALQSESVDAHMNTLNLLFEDGMKGEDPRGQPMIRALYKIVEKESAAAKFII